jgi:8-oxo-dGTP pyrophosphatase MutT (NUDIX family)
MTSKLVDYSKISAAAALIIGPMPVLRTLADSYNASSYIDASITLLAMSFSELISPDFHKYVPSQFQGNLRRFHLWEFMIKVPELITVFEQLDRLDMGFLLQLEILCIDIPSRSCQQAGAPKCSGCQYKTRTIGVSANGRVDVHDHTDKNNNPHTYSATLMQAALREVREEMNMSVRKAADPVTQSRYRAALTLLLAEAHPHMSEFKVPDLFYDIHKYTRMQVLIVDQNDVCPRFICSQPYAWKYQESWDTYVSVAVASSWCAARKQPSRVRVDNRSRLPVNDKITETSYLSAARKQPSRVRVDNRSRWPVNDKITETSYLSAARKQPSRVRVDNRSRWPVSYRHVNDKITETSYLSAVYMEKIIYEKIIYEKIIYEKIIYEKIIYEKINIYFLFSMI